MTKKEACLFSTVCFLSGLVLGFLLAPAKHGVMIGSHNQFMPHRPGFHGHGCGAGHPHKPLTAEDEDVE